MLIEPLVEGGFHLGEKRIRILSVLQPQLSDLPVIRQKVGPEEKVPDDQIVAEIGIGFAVNFGSVLRGLREAFGHLLLQNEGAVLSNGVPSCI